MGLGNAVVVAAVTILVGGCVNETFPQGLPCATDGKLTCPPGQVCNREGTDFICRSQGPGGIDGAVLGAIDAAPCPPEESCNDGGGEATCDEPGQPCASDQVCYWVQKRNEAVCFAPGGGGQGESCLDHTACEQGLGCHPNEFGDLVCLRYTDVNDGACVDFELLDGEFGYCRVENS